MGNYSQANLTFEAPWPALLITSWSIFKHSGPPSHGHLRFQIPRCTLVVAHLTWQFTKLSKDGLHATGFQEVSGEHH